MSTTRVVNIRFYYKKCTKYIGRPSKYGNPFIVNVHGTRDQCCDYHQEWLEGKREAPDGRKPPTRKEIISELKGQILGCFCAPKRCHGDNYVRICEETKE